MAENRFLKYVQPQAVAAPSNRFSKYVAAPTAVPSSAPEDGPLNWSDVPGKMMENTPASAAKFVQDMAYPIMNPRQTVESMADLGAGALREGARAVLPTSIFNAIDSVGGAERQKSGERASDTAGAVADYFKDRYGSAEGFKKALAEDPVGVAGDLSSVLTGGSSAAYKMAGKTSKIGSALNRAGNVLNPATVPIEAAKVTGKAAAATTKAILGLTTGTSGDTISEAYHAAKKGGDTKKAFTNNLRGLEEQDVVIGDARDALGNIAEQRRKQYVEDMRAVKANTTPIDFKPIEAEFASIVDDAFYKGRQTASKETMSKLKEIGAAVDEWSLDPALHTAEGLDALKKKIDDLMPSFTDADNKASAVRAVTAVRNAIKDQIVAAAPEYAKAMKGYEDSKTIQREIERSLSLGKKASADTTLRKLQSLTRNNVNTNFGARMKSAEILEKAGAKNLMPRLSGQALNAKIPRGLMGQILGGGAVLGGQFLNPLFLAGLPFASPRLVGEAANLAGTGARYASRVPRPTRKQLLMSRNLGTLSLLGQDSQEQ